MFTYYVHIKEGAKIKCCLSLFWMTFGLASSVDPLNFNNPNSCDVLLKFELLLPCCHFLIEQLRKFFL